MRRRWHGSRFKNTLCRACCVGTVEHGGKNGVASKARRGLRQGSQSAEVGKVAQRDQQQITR